MFHTFPAGNGVNDSSDTINEPLTLLQDPDRLMVIMVMDEDSLTDLTTFDSLDVGGVIPDFHEEQAVTNPAVRIRNRLYSIPDVNYPSGTEADLSALWGAGGFNFGRKIYVWQFSGVHQELFFQGNVVAVGASPLSFPYSASAGSTYFTGVITNVGVDFTSTPADFTEDNNTIVPGLYGFWGGTGDDPSSPPASYNGIGMMAGFFIQLVDAGFFFEISAEIQSGPASFEGEIALNNQQFLTAMSDDAVMRILIRAFEEELLMHLQDFDVWSTSNPPCMVQTHQPAVAGVETDPTWYIQKLTGLQYGYQGRLKARDSQTGVFNVAEQKVKIRTFQISALRLEDPDNEVLFSAFDMLDLAATVAQSRPFADKLMKNYCIGIERVSEVREPYFYDDTDGSETDPNFDFTISYSTVVAYETEAVARVNPEVRAVE